MNKLRHVFSIANKFSFRLALPGHKFICSERFDSERECAEAADFFKLFLVRQYGVKGSSVLPSLPIDDFKALIIEIGLDSHNMKDIFIQLSGSCKSFVQEGGGDMIQDYMKSEALARKKGFDDV